MRTARSMHMRCCARKKVRRRQIGLVQDFPQRKMARSHPVTIFLGFTVAISVRCDKVTDAFQKAICDKCGQRFANQTAVAHHARVQHKKVYLFSFTEKLCREGSGIFKVLVCNSTRRYLTLDSSY